MIELVDIRYVRLGTADLEGAVRYATGTLGLELVGRENGRAYVRGDDRDHNICYIEGQQSGQNFSDIYNAQVATIFKDFLMYYSNRADTRKRSIASPMPLPIRK